MAKKIEDRDGVEFRWGEGLEDYEPAEVPIEATRCPGCGERPTDQSVALHSLSANGYVHDDVVLECQSETCDREWTLGIPLGDPAPSFYEDLTCGCGTTAMVHRVQVTKVDGEPSAVRLHLKCPYCYSFFKALRPLDDNGVALMGFREITGATDDANVKPYGY